MAALLLTACGDDEAAGILDQLTGSSSDESEATEEPADAEPVAADETPEAPSTTEDEGGSETSTAEPEADPTPVAARSIEAAVHHSGLEYTFGELTVIDLDAEASEDGQFDQRVRGVQLTFDVSVFNPSNDTKSPAPAVSLRWDEPGSDNVVDVTGRSDFRQVPGDSSSSGEITVTLAPADLEVYDDASARLIVGRSGLSPAQVPVGSNADLIDRFPVPQPGVDGSFDVDEVLVTITDAEIRWDYTGNEHVEDGMALLELTYTMENLGDRQSCSTGREGAFALTLPNGDGIVDLRVTERCVRGGETVTDVRTGFFVDADYAGDYTIRHERSGDETDEFSFTLVETAGVPSAERNTR